MPKPLIDPELRVKLVQKVVGEWDWYRKKIDGKWNPPKGIDKKLDKAFNDPDLCSILTRIGSTPGARLLDDILIKNPKEIGIAESGGSKAFHYLDEDHVFDFRTVAEMLKKVPKDAKIRVTTLTNSEPHIIVDDLSEHLEPKDFKNPAKNFLEKKKLKPENHFRENFAPKRRAMV